MTFLWPWFLPGLAVVGAVALWALFRRSRQLAIVGSLKLWAEALASLDRPLHGRRRVTAAWLCLLAGAVAGVLAMARPVYYAERPVRHVAVEILRSAELASPEQTSGLNGALGALIGRLDKDDRVQFIFPNSPLGRWRRVGEYRTVADVRPVPVRAMDLKVIPPAPDAQHLYVFAAAGSNIDTGLGRSVIEITSVMPPVTFDAVGAEPLPGGNVQIFVAVRNHSDSPWSGFVETAGVERSGAETESAAMPLSVDAGQRKGLVLKSKPVEAVRMRLTGGRHKRLPDYGAEAFLVRRPAVVKAVAMTGRDEPMVRRFIRIDPMLLPVGDVKDADVVVAVGAAAPADKPALLIDPPAAPAGWRRGETLSDILLRDADVAADDPVMRGVELGSVAVRRVRPWRAAAAAGQRSLMSYKGQSLVVRNSPKAGAAGETAPRQIYVAFDIGGGNTNFAMTDAFVVFLANAMRHLAPGGAGRQSYCCITPMQAGLNTGWSRFAGQLPPDLHGGLPEPGIYRDAADVLHAVSLTGLRGGRAKLDPLKTVAAVPLPRPQPMKAPVEFWPALVAIAVLLWLAGWALRLPIRSAK